MYIPCSANEIFTKGTAQRKYDKSINIDASIDISRKKSL